MENSSAKLLDEACNQLNESYGDEVLYAAWADPPQRYQEVALVEVTPTGNDGAEADAFLARMYACQG